MKCMTFVLAVVATCASAWAQVPVEGAPGASLSSIEGTSTLVTVVLRSSGARDANLQIAEVGDDSIGVLTERGERYTYLLSAIERVIVQDGVVAIRRVEPDAVRILSQEEEMILAAAWQQARQVFEGANDNQIMKMRAAAVLALPGGDAFSPQGEERRREALEYLRAFLTVDDLQSAVDAATALYLAGETNIDPIITERAVMSGNRTLRVSGAQLAGLLGHRQVQNRLFELRGHRMDDVSAAATIALGRIGAPLEIDGLLRDIAGLSEQRAEAAVAALSSMGGDSVKAACMARIEEIDGVRAEWMLLVRVLYNLEDPAAMQLLRTEGMQHRVYQREAAVLLARRGDWEAAQALRRRLDERVDPNELQLTYQVRAIVALYEGGQPAAITDMQRMLRLDATEVVAPGMQERARQRVVNVVHTTMLQEMARTGNSRLLFVVQPVLQRPVRWLAFEGVQAAFAMADPGFRERLTAVWDS